LGTAPATGYGYSLWEFQVYGTTGSGTGTPISQYKQVATPLYPFGPGRTTS
jgi:hypothetical protein